MRFLEMILSGAIMVIFWKAVEFHIHNISQVTISMLMIFTIFFFMCVYVTLHRCRDKLNDAHRDNE